MLVNNRAYLCRHQYNWDGLLTALHLAALAQTGMRLSELVDQSFQTYPQLLRNVRVEDRDRRKAGNSEVATSDRTAKQQWATKDEFSPRLWH